MAKEKIEFDPALDLQLTREVNVPRSLIWKG
jgi:hypothetical protein